MIRNAIRNFINFLRLLLGMPPTRGGVSNAGARQAREAMHVSVGPGGGSAFSGGSSADNLLGKAIASGHQKKVYGDPASKNRVVGYGERAPKVRQKPSGLVTIVLVWLLLGVVVYLLI